eukprot:3764578-Alexandrium_andersonii.AAC.1
MTLNTTQHAGPDRQAGVQAAAGERSCRRGGGSSDAITCCQCPFRMTLLARCSQDDIACKVLTVPEGVSTGVAA